MTSEIGERIGYRPERRLLRFGFSRSGVTDEPAQQGIEVVDAVGAHRLLDLVPDQATAAIEEGESRGLDLVAELIDGIGWCVARTLEHESRDQGIRLAAVAKRAAKIAWGEDRRRTTERLPDQEPGIIRPTPVDKDLPSSDVRTKPARKLWDRGTIRKAVR